VFVAAVLETACILLIGAGFVGLRVIRGGERPTCGASTVALRRTRGLDADGNET
jgi:hypothetical protein